MTTYERDGLGRTRPVVDHSADPLVPPVPETAHESRWRVLFARIFG